MGNAAETLCFEDRLLPKKEARMVLGVSQPVWDRIVMAGFVRKAPMSTTRCYYSSREVHEFKNMLLSHFDFMDKHKTAVIELAALDKQDYAAVREAKALALGRPVRALDWFVYRARNTINNAVRRAQRAA